MDNLRFSHFIINGSTTDTSWINPYQQCATSGVDYLKSGQGLVKVFFIREVLH